MWSDTRWRGMSLSRDCVDRQLAEIRFVDDDDGPVGCT